MQSVGSPAVRCDEADADIARDLSISFSCLDSYSLVPGVDEVDVGVSAAYQERVKVASMKAKSKLAA